MKSLLKNIELRRVIGLRFKATLFLCALGLTTIQAQSTGSEGKTSTITVTGKVVASLEGQAILIESVSVPVFEQENIDDTEITVDPISSSGAGFLIAKGESNRVFQAVFPSVITLTNLESNSPLNVRITISHNSTVEQSSSSYVREEVSSFTLNENGEYYFWFGGAITISEVEEGGYDGDFTLEVEYI